MPRDGLPPRSYPWIVVVALVPRLIFGLEQSSLPTTTQLEGGDSRFYHRVAAGEEEPPRAYFHSPLYRYFVAGVYAAAGPRPGAVRWLQHALGVLAAYLAYLLALRLFGRGKVALLAGLLVGLSGPLIFYEGHLIPAGVIPVLMLGFALALERYIKEQGAKQALILGVSIGVNALARATALVWLPLALLIGWRKPRLARQGALMLGAALMIAPVTLRNLAVEGDWVLISANAGLNFYIGNHAGARGSYALPPGVWFVPGDPRDDFAGHEAVANALGRPPSSSEASRWWAGRAWEYIRSHPGESLGLIGQKALLWFHHGELPQLYDYRAYQLAIPSLRYLPPAGPTLVLALLGLALLLVRRHPDLVASRSYAIAALLFAGAFLPFFVVGRYRGPWLAFVAPAAAFAFFELFARLRQLARASAWRAALPLPLALIVAAGFVYWPMAPPPRSAQLLAFGRAAMAAGDRPAGERWLRMAIAESPNHWAAIAAAERLARSLLEPQSPTRWPEGRRVLERVRKAHPDAPALKALWGRYLLLDGQLEAAERALRDALSRAPSDVGTWLDLARTKARQGAYEAAREACRSALTLEPRSAAARQLLSSIQRPTSRPAAGSRR